MPRGTPGRIHYPCIEAGRVTPLCGGAHVHLEWTTAAEKVSCWRCRELLRRSEAAELAQPRGGSAGGDARSAESP